MNLFAFFTRKCEEEEEEEDDFVFSFPQEIVTKKAIALIYVNLFAFSPESVKKKKEKKKKTILYSGFHQKL